MTGHQPSEQPADRAPRIDKPIDKPIIVALDYANARDALALVDQLAPALCRVKVGVELFTAAGPALVTRLQDAGFEVFLDLKFHDIPTTVAQAVKVAADLGVWMVNVHAQGGARMLAAARQALDEQGGATLLIAVTVLTSMTAADLRELGVAGSPAAHAVTLAELAHRSGMDGVVCSAQEAGAIAQTVGAHFLRVTPGIRPSGAVPAGDDQRRTLTPAQALAAGSNYLVIGRPVTRAVDPVAALLAIRAEIQDH